MKSVCALAIGLLLAGPGCALFKSPRTPAEQATAALSTEGKEGAWIGHLDSKLSPVGDKDVAFSAQSDTALHFLSVAEGQLCFSIVWDQQFFSAHDTVDEVVESRMAAARAASFVFEARDSLDYAPEAVWPAHVTNDVKLVRLGEKKRTTQTHQANDATKRWTSENLYTRVELCGAAPKLGPATKYVTITRYKPEGEKGAPALYVWKVDGAVDGSLVIGSPSAESTTPSPHVSTASIPTSVTDPASAPTMPPVGPPVAGNLVDVMASAGTYSKFLKLVDAAGLTAQLKSAGTYTVFAPTDHAFAREPGYFVAGLLKDNAALERMVRAHIAVTSYDRAALDRPQSVDVMTLSSRKEVRSSAGHLKLGGSFSLDEEKKASNGVLWAIDAVMQN